MAEWQPIDTAPVNQSVLVYIPSPVAEHYGPGIYRAILVDTRPDFRAPYWTTTALNCGSDVASNQEPTHWMPLPDLPSLSKHMDHCGLKDDHEGECAAVVTRLLGV